MKSKEKEYRSAYWKKWYAINRPKSEKPCIVCGKVFRPKGAKNNRCPDCQYLICQKCGKKFKTDRYNKKYCSKKCRIETQKGIEPEHLKNNRGVKPRTYHLNKRDKHGGMFDRDWRSAVFLRDDYTCQECGKRGGKLQAHHIKPYKKHPELRYVLSNGVTLCLDCHKKTDTYGWANYHKNKIAAQRMCQEVLDL